MKAEHRQGIADQHFGRPRGRLMQGMKERPKKRFLVWVILGLIVLGVVFFLFRLRQASARELSENWSMVEDGYFPYFERLKEENGDINPGKAAPLSICLAGPLGPGLEATGQRRQKRRRGPEQ